jgi:hypothetical protein
MDRETGPVLVIMAAGMGSRFGGLKQIEPVDEEGRCLMDYAVFDSLNAGFRRILFVIRKDFEQDFRELIGSRTERKADVGYVYQDLGALPAGRKIPEGRLKPWGTAHAVWCCMNALRGVGFLTVNADDFYCADAYRVALRFLSAEDDRNVHALIGYDLTRTLSENGTVSRGVCAADADGRLLRIDERRRVRLKENVCEYQEADDGRWHLIPRESLASMNMWAFRPGFLTDLQDHYERRFLRGLDEKPLSFEETLSEAVQDMLVRNAGEVRVLPTQGQWIGMTYREDEEAVKRALFRMVGEGQYPQSF